MRRVYHLVTPSAWETTAEADYHPASLGAEGFIHCSHADQVARSANRFYAGVAELLLLHIDPERLTSALVEEPADSGELFPHLYGPLNRSAVVRVEALRRGAGGAWQFTA